MIGKKSGLIKNAGLILLLVSLFIVDDILIYLLFKNIYDWEVDLIYFGFGATSVLILNLGLACAVFKIMHKRPTTGQQGMIGRKGVVLKSKNGEYQVLPSGISFSMRIMPICPRGWTASTAMKAIMPINGGFRKMLNIHSPFFLIR